MLRFVEKLLALAGGILCVYLGYRLFIKGVSGEASLKVEHDKSKLQLLNSAPGIFFALFGMVLLGLVVWRQTNVFVLEPVSANVEIDQLTPLPSTESELDAIRQAYEKVGHVAGPQLSIEKANSLMNKVKKGEYRIIHIASHGYFVGKSKTETEENHEE